MATGTLITTPFGFETTAAEVVEGVDLTGKRADRHRRRLRHRRRDRPRARGRRRRRHARGARHRGGRPDRRRHQGHDRPRGARRPARPRRPGLRRRVRGRLERPAAHPRQQRGRDGGAGARAVARGLGPPVRHQPSRPLRARHAAARRARGRRRRARRLGQLGRAPALAGDLRRPALRVPPVRPVARLRPVQDGERAVRGRGRPALGRRRDPRQRADAGRDRHQPAAPRRPGADRERASKNGFRLKTVAAGRRDLGPAGRVARCVEGAGGRYFDDCNESEVVHRRDAEAGARGVAAYAVDPANAERLWEVSEELVG